MKARFLMAERERFIQLSDGAERGSLRGLTAGVGVNLSIEHTEAPRLAGGWPLLGGRSRGRDRLLIFVAGVAVNHLLQELSYALLQTIGAHHRLLVTESHTETELAEVLEQ